MDPVLLPRLKPSMAVRNELREVIELYVDYVAGRRMPRTHALLAAEPAARYQRVVTS